MKIKLFSKIIAVGIFVTGALVFANGQLHQPPKTEVICCRL